jgi:hypothetical protein
MGWNYNERRIKMRNLDLFLLVLSAIWLCGSALSVGLVISRRKKKMPATWVLFVWGVVLSWAFVGWIVGEMMALAIKSLGEIATTAVGQSKE